MDFTADRPGASTGPGVVGHHVIQLEQGIAFNNEDDKPSFTSSNTLLRYGILDGMEIRIGIDGSIYRSTRTHNTIAAFSGLNIGTKIRCHEGRGALPAIALMANMVIPHTGGRELAQSTSCPQYTYSSRTA